MGPDDNDFDTCPECGCDTYVEGCDCPNCDYDGAEDSDETSPSD